MLTIEDLLMKFPSGLQLYMERDRKVLNGITLRIIEEEEIDWADGDLDLGLPACYDVCYARFDVTADDSHKLCKSICHQDLDHEGLDDYFNCYVLNKTQSWNRNILETLFIAEGTYAGSSLQDILNMSDKICAKAGSPLNVLDDKLNRTEVAAAAAATTEILKKELELITLIEAQIKAIQELKDIIAHKRKIIEKLECQ